MCGIAGFTHPGRPADPALMRRAAMDLVHRGPDQQGTHESADVSLAAVRLKIIDLSGGEQPMYSADRDHVIVFNGEIYNFVELREELESLGHRFQSHCDTEVVLEAFRQWDTACFEKMRGMFGLAIWCESRRRLVIARDRMGIKPLYYRVDGDQLYFGSELKALLVHECVPRRLNLQALDYYLALNYVPCPFTLIDGIRKLPPGHWLEWRAGEARVQPYWQLRFQPDATWSVDSARERLDSLLREAVREHMVSDVPLGIWSSGGIDSSTILHYAAESASGPLKTFSVSFRGRSFDESPWFRQIAKRYATDHYEFDMNPEVELADAIEQFAWFSDEPSADAGALPVWFLSRMSRQQVTVALAGDGGDELFGGYVTYLADRYRQSLTRLPRVLRAAGVAAAHGILPVSDDKISFEYKVKRMIEGSLLGPDDAHFYWNGAHAPWQRRTLLRGKGGAPLGRLAQAAGLRDSLGGLNRYILLDHHYYLPDDILVKVDRMSMAHSLEVRPPFLDHRLVEFAASLPENFKIRGSTLKFLLKSLMKGKLPDSVLYRQKAGFDVPAHDWFRGVLLPLLRDTVTVEAIRDIGVFDENAIETLVADHVERRRNSGYHLWGLLALFLWIRRWNVLPPSSAAG